MTVKKSKGAAGRPSSFERSEAVRTALDLFWANGYEGVSIGDLTAAIGVAPPSLYHAFGSKAGLFEEAVELYQNTEAGLELARLESATTIVDWARALLEMAAANVTCNGRACLISTGMIMAHPSNIKVANTLAMRRSSFRQSIGENLRRWLPERNAYDVAAYLQTVLQGMSIHARDGATKDDLKPIIDLAISAIARDGK